MANPLLADPSQTALARRQFTAEVKRRFTALYRAIYELLVVEDAFGLSITRQGRAFAPLANTRFAFESNAGKLRSFKRWLAEQVDKGTLRTDAAKYIKSAYQQGLSRAYLENRVREAVDDDLLNFVLTSRERFVRVTLAEAKTVSKLEVLYTRAFDELEDVTRQMSVQLGRILSEGLLANHKPRTIALAISKQMGISQKRALLIAQTEIVHAQAEGQLDAYDRLGITKLGLKVELTTAGDEKVCPICRARAGKVYTVKKAHGIIPLHPRCRCAWVPYVEAKPKRRVSRSTRNQSGLLTAV